MLFRSTASRPPGTPRKRRPGCGRKRPAERAPRAGAACKLEFPVKDIAEKYAESSIFVLSSRFEGFGLVIVEAMACGLPVISFDCPCGPKDIIMNNKDGMLVSSGDVDGLVRQLLYLIEHDERRKQMGNSALVNVQRYKIENIAILWKDLFNMLLQEKNSK